MPALKHDGAKLRNPKNNKEVVLRLFWELVRRSFQRQLTYRAAMMAGLFTNFFFGLFRVAILLALFGANEVVEGYTAEGLITYTGLTQAMLGFMQMFGWYELMTAVYSGDVSSDLLKPMGFFNFWVGRDLGQALVQLLLRGVGFMLLFEIAYDLSYPETAVQWLALIFSLALSWFLSFEWRFLINLSSFWSPQAKGIIRFGFMAALFFSGFLMPIGLLPEWVQRIAYATPFPYFLDVPVEIYLGILTGAELGQALLFQLIWVVVLYTLCRLVLNQAFRRLVILGG